MRVEQKRHRTEENCCIDRLLLSFLFLNTKKFHFHSDLTRLTWMLWRSPLIFVPLLSYKFHSSSSLCDYNDDDYRWRLISIFGWARTSNMKIHWIEHKQRIFMEIEVFFFTLFFPFYVNPSLNSKLDPTNAPTTCEVKSIDIDIDNIFLVWFWMSRADDARDEEDRNFPWVKFIYIKKKHFSTSSVVFTRCWVFFAEIDETKGFSRFSHADYVVLTFSWTFFFHTQKAIQDLFW